MMPSGIGCPASVLPERGVAVGFDSVRIQETCREASVPTANLPCEATTGVASLRLSRSFAFPLGTPDEVEHERHGRSRVHLKQLVASIENVGLHPRQSAHPGQDLGELEEWN